MQRFDPLGFLWRILYRPATGATLLILTAAAILLTAVVPQMPVGTPRSVPDFWLWVSGLPSPWRNWGGFLLTTHAFEISRSLWFRFILGLGSLCLLVRLFEEAHSWRENRPLASTELLEARKGEIRSESLPGGVESALAAVERALKRVLFRRIRLYRERTRYRFEAHGWYPPELARVVLYAGVLLVCLGIMLAPALDWGQQVALAPADEFSLGSGLSLRLDELHDGSNPAAQLGYLAAGREMRSGVVSPGTPLAYRGYRVHLLSLGPALRLRVRDSSGAPLEPVVYPGGHKTAGEVRLSFVIPNEEKYLFLPDHKLIIRCLMLPRGDDRFEVEILNEGDISPIAKAWVSEASSLEAGGISVEAEPSRFAWLYVERTPSWWITLAGGILAGLAMVAVTVLPGGRVVGFLQEEKDRTLVHWVQEDPLNRLNLAAHPPLVESLDV